MSDKGCGISRHRYLDLIDNLYKVFDISCKILYEWLYIVFIVD